MVTRPNRLHQISNISKALINHTHVNNHINSRIWIIAYLEIMFEISDSWDIHYSKRHWAKWTWWPISQITQHPSHPSHPHFLLWKQAFKSPLLSVTSSCFSYAWYKFACVICHIWTLVGQTAMTDRHAHTLTSLQTHVLFIYLSQGQMRMFEKDNKAICSKLFLLYYEINLTENQKECCN